MALVMILRSCGGNFKNHRGNGAFFPGFVVVTGTRRNIPNQHNIGSDSQSGITLSIVEKLISQDNGGLLG